MPKVAGLTRPTRCRIEKDHLERWLLKGVNRKDIGHEIIEELGFSVSLIASPAEAQVPLRVHCGCYTKWVKNTCTMRFRSKTGVGKKLLQAPLLVKIALAVIRHWQPDHGIITSDAVALEPGPATDFSMEAGWITFLSGENYHRVSEVEPPAQVVDAHRGQLIVATNGIFSANNENHLVSLRHIRSLIRKRLYDGRLTRKRGRQWIGSL